MIMRQESLEELARRLAKDGPHKSMHTSRRIRILFNGVYIADTTSAAYVWEHPFYPQYYLPLDDFDKSHIKVDHTIKDREGNDIADVLMIQVGGRSTKEVFCFVGKGGLAGMVKVDFNAVDQWFEEDSPIYVHPKDPYKRVDIVSSSRPLKISIEGHLLAETTSSMHLYETDLPVRYYIPLTSVDVSKLRPSETRSLCPYKGEAEYYSVDLDGKSISDVIWYYTRPTIECAAVAGLVCFYNEKVDIEIMEGGKWVKLERPQSPFS